MENNMSTFTGGCLCGGIKYEICGEQTTFLSCYCRDCQYITGGSPSNVIFIQKATLSITKGTPCSFRSKSESGTDSKRYFCGNCGTHMFGETEKFQGSIVLKVGSLDDPSMFEPTMNVWVASAQPWHYIDPNLKKFDKNPT